MPEVSSRGKQAPETPRRTLLSLLLFIVSGWLASVANAQLVEIPDPGLLGAVREALSKLVGPITVADMEGLMELSANQRDIESIAGVEAARNLRWLDLDRHGDHHPNDNLGGTVSGGRFTVIFDMTSTPTIMELTSTVFRMFESLPQIDAISGPEGPVALGNEITVGVEYVVLGDPNGGFVTGGGWIDSPTEAYVFDPTLSGKATFGFVSKYKKGQSVPTGETQFQFQAGDFKFHSTAYEWLVVSGARAQYKGVGKVNSVGDYGFLLTATDGQLSGGGGIDRFRIKIWDRVSGIVVYDNVPNAADDLKSADPQTISGGSIVIQQSK